MMDAQLKKDTHGKPYMEVSLDGYALITNPLLNKGMAFTDEERESFHLFGLLPTRRGTIEEQSERSYLAFSKKTTDLEKYIYLRDLQDSNETLFYHLLTRHITEMLPIVYTPVVGAACEQFSQNYRRPRGLFIAYPDIAHIDKMLEKLHLETVEAIVVSDGERILGLGDQGAGGMGIPIGKLALYSACAGVNPAVTLPILLDSGTNNQDRINDPLYIGWKHERIRGKAYDEFIETFVQAIKKRFPNVLLQWEDFAQQNANPILEKYRDQLCTFNDDIQGTAAIATGTLLSALQVTGIPLKEHRIAVLGGGSAGCGISQLICQAMMDDGLTEEEARAQFYVVDRHGLLIEGATGLMRFQEPFCKPKQAVAHWNCADSNIITLLDVVKNIHPTVLIGVSGQPNTFTQEIIVEMAAHVERPVIFPLSNPTSRSEATPEDLIRWTNDKAIIGTGSPFPPVMRQGKLTRIDQTNNAYIFPGMGLGIIAIKASRVNDKMFMVAAKALAACSPSVTDPDANLLPELSHIREVSYQVALAVAKEAVSSGLAPQYTDEQIETLIRNKIWEPEYVPFKKKHQG